MPEFSAQQILRLCSHFHRAFLQKDKGQLIALASELQRHGHLLRPAEVSMALNHFAHSKILDEALWTTFSETLIQSYIEVDCKALGLAANAYARAMLQHEETLTFLARQVEAVAWKGQMEARNLAMVVNAFSKLRRRDEELMGAISFQLKSSARALNAVDLATVANGYARLWLHDAEVFEAMQEPLIDALPSCSIQNLAMIAHAYGRFFRRDEPLLLALCRQLLERQRRCGEVIPAENMGSIVHAYATRLRFCPEEFLRVVEHSLPKVVMQMELPDTILTVAALKNMPKESFDFPRIRGPVFAQCLKFMPKLMSSGLVSVMAAAVHLEHENPQFWTQIFWQGAASLRGSTWPAAPAAALALLLVELQGSALAKTEMVRLQEALAESVLSGGFSEMPLETLSDWAKALSRLQGFEVLKAPVLSEATRRLGAGVVPAAARKGLVEALQQMHGERLFEEFPFLARSEPTPTT
ncbi:unnamed protein product [Durusdinium trenchii]|uniref:RNA-editing substrate-binding complex 6 protein domain-containing protein n=2 Tax=Durusdinium trenchii TaxID=1381693 RepID=A0ABP0R2X7_9DINO